MRRTVALLDPAFTRDRAQWLCHLAIARIHIGAVEQACATANEAAGIIRRLDSPRDHRRLIEFRTAAAFTPAPPPSGSSTPSTAT